jgi:hypothetical protein
MLPYKIVNGKMVVCYLVQLVKLSLMPKEFDTLSEVKADFYESTLMALSHEVLVACVIAGNFFTISVKSGSWRNYFQAIKVSPYHITSYIQLQYYINLS